MDPQYITSSDWADTGQVLTFIWLLLIFAIGFGFNFLMAHAIIPSLVGSGHLPERFAKTRRVFYVGALLAMSLVIFALVNIASKAQFLKDIWDRSWI